MPFFVDFLCGSLWPMQVVRPSFLQKLVKLTPTSSKWQTDEHTFQTRQQKGHPLVPSVSLSLKKECSHNPYDSVYGLDLPSLPHLITFVHWSLLAKLPILRQVLRVLKTSEASNNFSAKSFSLLSCTWNTPGWKHGQIPLKTVKLQQFEVLPMLCKNSKQWVSGDFPTHTLVTLIVPCGEMQEEKSISYA